jgi:hypothetical protein
VLDQLPLPDDRGVLTSARVMFKGRGNGDED